MKDQIKSAIEVLRQGGVVAYPTEGVFGLGCDPFNKKAVVRLTKIKKRNLSKGLVLIAANWRQVEKLIKNNLFKSDCIVKNKNHPITWVFPATKEVPRWVRGKFKSIAIRVTLHPTAKKICQKFGGPIISTSANLCGYAPARTPRQVRKQFGDTIDFVVAAQGGWSKKATSIRDVITNKVLRK